jgi:predicted dehydrogenase
LRRLKIGVIGCGHWGPNLVRTFLELPEAKVEAVADLDPGRLNHVQTRHPYIGHFTRDFSELLDMGLDAVVVSTPPQTHFEIVRACVEHGLDVLVEKPLATTVADARRLVEMAERNGRIMLVGHIGAYNRAVGALKEMIDSGELGELRYIDAVRVGLGMFHPTLNVIWDLAPHDVAILLLLLNEPPETVSTRGIACIQATIEDVAYMTLMFPSGILAHARMSWLDPSKTRRITVVGSKKMVVFDDIESHEKLKVYDKRVNATRNAESYGDFHFAYHYGSVVSPYIDLEEPLRLECQHFIECVMSRRRPLTDGRHGLAVVQVIEAAQRSLSFGGAAVPILDEDARVGVSPSVRQHGVDGRELVRAATFEEAEVASVATRAGRAPAVHSNGGPSVNGPRGSSKPAVPAAIAGGFETNGVVER